MDSKFYDVVIIGGGSSGCTAAARISEDPSVEVLLLEAGPDPVPLPDMIADGTKGNQAILESPYTIMYPTERKADGSIYYPLSGRIMGGGSSVNMMAVVHPTEHDFHTWESLGNSGWSYEDCLPFLKRIETDTDFPDRFNHGHDGPITVTRRMDLRNLPEGIVKDFVTRSIAAGLALGDDWNTPNPQGVLPAASNVKNGLRQSTSVAYLQNARSRPNLTIISDALVHELVLANNHVNGVRYIKDSIACEISADKIVLTAGVYHSPQILELSGIGDPYNLRRIGIDIKHELIGVGANYQDHASVTVTYECAEGFNPEWLVPGFRLTYKSDSSLVNDDFHIFLRAPINVSGLKPMLPITSNLIEQRTRGSVHIVSRDPAVLPVIDDALLQDSKDIKAMAKSLQFIDNLVTHESMAHYFSRRIQPDQSENIEEFITTTYDCYHHGVGTCMMGPTNNSMSVVDHQLKVHGIDNLYIADASVIPTIPHANTNMAAILMGERVAHFVTNS